MREHTTTSVIEAPADRVWSILTDAAGYKNWNPEIVDINGRMALGERAEFRMHLAMSGPLLPMILKSVGDRQPEVDSFSAALKRRAEER